MKSSKEAFRILRSAFESALKEVDPASSVSSHLLVEGTRLYVITGKGERVEITPKEGGKLAIISTGKAAIPMIRAAAERATFPGPRLAVAGEIAHVEGVETIASSHPLPDERSLKAGERIYRVVSELGPSDSLLYLISGGSSAMVAFPEKGISLSEKRIVQKELMEHGADIFELNSVRRALSRIKGGKLAENLRAGRSAVLVLSDVPGNDPSTVGSGPLHPPPKEPKPDEVLRKYGLEHLVPRELLAGRADAEPKPLSPPPHVVVADNEKAVRAASNFLKNEGYEVIPTKVQLEGEARKMGRILGETLVKMSKEMPHRRAALVAGGETVVKVKGRGKGGRNQELALSAAIAISGEEGIYGLCAGTDGRDGNSPAAGGFFDGRLVRRALELDLDPVRFLDDNDTYTLLSRLGYALETGDTGTNVMDIFIAIVERT